MVKQHPGEAGSSEQGRLDSEQVSPDGKKSCTESKKGWLKRTASIGCTERKRFEQEADEAGQRAGDPGQRAGETRQRAGEA